MLTFNKQNKGKRRYKIGDNNNSQNLNLLYVVSLLNIQKYYSLINMFLMSNSFTLIEGVR